MHNQYIILNLSHTTIGYPNPQDAHSVCRRINASQFEYVRFRFRSDNPVSANVRTDSYQGV